MEENRISTLSSLIYELPISFAGMADRIRAYCNEEGRKGVENKVMIAAHLWKENGFIDAESLWLKIGTGKTISRATVYLVLNWLVLHDFAVKHHSGIRMYSYRLKP